MKKIKFWSLKFLKLILKIFSIIGMFLIISNIMRVFYNYIGKFIAGMHDLYMEKKVSYADISATISKDIKYDLQEKIFLKNCNFGAEQGGYGRYMPYINKICIISTGDKYIVNHELIHYKLRNLPIDKKLLMRGKIKKQISNIKKALNLSNINQLTGDDKTYFEILSGEIYKYANDPVYKFFDRIEFIAISHRGNEEFIAYAVGNLIELDQNNEMYFINFKLNNPLLQEIQDGYLNIYKELVPLKEDPTVQQKPSQDKLSRSSNNKTDF